MFALWGVDFLRAVFVEAFTRGNAALDALIKARVSLLKQLGNPTDPLEKAREMQRHGFHWRWIWAPEPEPKVQYSAGRFPYDAQGNLVRPPPPPPIRMRRVADLLQELAATVPRERMGEGLLRKLGW